MLKKAVCQCSDTGPLESLAVMLAAAGYQCWRLGPQLAGHLKRLGCDTVATVEERMRQEGVEMVFDMPVANAVGDLQDADLYVDVKAQRNAVKVWRRHPNLKDKTLWYRINGGEPEHVIQGGFDYGDEVNPPCPILTPDLWYRDVGPWSDRAYAVWPPFFRFDDYYQKRGRATTFEPPICLVHNLAGWGYGAWAEGCRDVGLRIYGRGSPDGLIDHARIPELLSKSIAMVHLKQSDAPGYALYEAMAAACPLVISQRLIVKNWMQDLFEDRVTCLLFDRIEKPELVHGSATPEQVVDSIKEIGAHLHRLSDPAENAKMGMAAHDRLKEIMWEAGRDGDGLRSWFARVFSCG
jgi:hypothetical protein